MDKERQNDLIERQEQIRELACKIAKERIAPYTYANELDKRIVWDERR